MTGLGSGLSSIRPSSQGGKRPSRARVTFPKGPQWYGPDAGTQGGATSSSATLGLGLSVSAAELPTLPLGAPQQAWNATGGAQSRGGVVGGIASRMGLRTGSAGTLIQATNARGARGNARRSAIGAAECDEVRNLGNDKPSAFDALVVEGTHEALMMRLKSRAARVEADSQKEFLAKYRACNQLDRDSETRLDRILKSAEKKAEELKTHSDELIKEVAEAELAVERANKLHNSAKVKEEQLQAMSAFERNTYLVQADKREEELQHQRDEAQSNYNKAQRRLQSELIELRDYKVLLGEYRRLRLDKLQENLGRVTDGRKLRQIVREMIRQGGQRVLSRLQAAPLPLEPWMSEVLVNCCHLEIRMEDAIRRLQPLQAQALEPLRPQVERMVQQPKESRFTRLCAWTWDNLRDSDGDEDFGLPGSVSSSVWSREDLSRWAQKANPWKRPPVPPLAGPGSVRETDDEGGTNGAKESPISNEAASRGLAFRPPEQAARHGTFRGLATVVTQALAGKNKDDEQMLAQGAWDKGDTFMALVDAAVKAAKIAAMQAAAPAEADDLPIVHAFAAEKPEVLAAEAEVRALQLLLEDTRQNATAAICSRIRQADKGGMRGGASAMDWGKQMLTLMVSEDFAKAATKELRKSQPQAMLTA